jgi:hypothetical protein
LELKIFSERVFSEQIPTKQKNSACGGLNSTLAFLKVTLGFRVEKGLPKILRGLTRGVRTPLARQLRGQKILNFQNFGTSELKIFLGNKKLFRTKNAKKSLSSKNLELKKCLFFWDQFLISKKNHKFQKLKEFLATKLPS